MKYPGALSLDPGCELLKHSWKKNAQRDWNEDRREIGANSTETEKS